MGRNSFAAQIVAAKKAISNQERKAIVKHCLTTVYQAAAIGLNEEFGFGAERIERFRDKLNDTLLEFGVLQDDTDTDYAMGALERRYSQIMGDDRQ